LLPSEYLGADTFSHNGSIDFLKAFLIALKNEVNIEPHTLTNLIPFAMVEENSLTEDHYYLVFQGDISMTSFAIKKAHLEAAQDEYEQIKSVPVSQLSSFLSQETGHNMKIANYILAQKGYLALESNCA